MTSSGPKKENSETQKLKGYLNQYNIDSRNHDQPAMNTDVDNILNFFNIPDNMKKLMINPNGREAIMKDLSYIQAHPTDRNAPNQLIKDLNKWVQ